MARFDPIRHNTCAITCDILMVTNYGEKHLLTWAGAFLRNGSERQRCMVCIMAIYRKIPTSWGGVSAHRLWRKRNIKEGSGKHGRKANRVSTEIQER